MAMEMASLCSPSFLFNSKFPWLPISCRSILDTEHIRQGRHFCSSRNKLPLWLSSDRHGTSNSVTSTGSLNATEPMWWKQGVPVKSIEIACRDEAGKELDPWRLSDMLLESGALSASVYDAARGTPEEVPIYVDCDPPQAFDRSVARATSTGRKELWGGNSCVVAMYPAEWDLAAVAANVKEMLGVTHPLQFQVHDVVEEDWVKRVQETWEPIETGRLRIRFPWHEPMEPSEWQPDQVELVLQGGNAFGTGEHATTAMCCAWLEQVAEGSRILDYGSGSGILGLAALKFGAKEAVGIELDLDSIATAHVNAAANGLHMDNYYPQEVETNGDIDLVLTKLVTETEARVDGSGSGTDPLPVSDGKPISLAELGTFDVTVSNILAGTLVRLKPVLTQFTRPGGKLALTGILESQSEGILEAYRDDFDISVAQSMEGWVLLTGVRRG